MRQSIHKFVISFTCLLSLLATTEAVAIYDPGTGRFMQRDPSGMPGFNPARLGSDIVGLMPGSFIDHDSNEVYPDGMNLYVAYHAMSGGVDPSGLKVARVVDKTPTNIADWTTMRTHEAVGGRGKPYAIWKENPCGTVRAQYQLDASHKWNSPKDADKNLTKKFMGPIVEFSFSKKDNCKTAPGCCCNKFNWIQIYRVSSGDNKWKYDSEKPAKHPYYNPDKPDLDRETLWDYPGNTRDEQVQFISLLKCVDGGKNDGKTFTTIAWGYRLIHKTETVKFAIKMK
jgi:hypothetical protein